MTADWIDDFKNTSDNALTVDWFISPLEYYWENGRSLFDKMFRSPGTPHSAWDEHISPALFRMSMQVDFRAKMMVFAFMRQNIAKSYGLEIESGLIRVKTQ